MGRARSPFFYFNYVFLWLSTVCYVLWMGTTRQTSDIVHRDPTIPMIAHGAGVLGLIFTGGLLFFGVLELLIWRGWEPRFLETMKPGCEVIAVSPLPGYGSTIYVQFMDGGQETYEADRSEAPDLQPGATCHLWVIGKYVSRYRILEESADRGLLQKIALDPSLEPRNSLSSSLMMTMISALFTGMGLVAMITKHANISSNRANTWGDSHSIPLDGIDASIFGFVFFVIGVLMMAVFGVIWRIGWKQAGGTTGTPSSPYKDLWQ